MHSVLQEHTIKQKYSMKQSSPITSMVLLVAPALSDNGGHVFVGSSWLHNELAFENWQAMHQRCSTVCSTYEAEPLKCK